MKGDGVKSGIISVLKGKWPAAVPTCAGRGRLGNIWESDEAERIKQYFQCKSHHSSLNTL